MSDTPRTYVVVGDNNLVLTEDVARYQDILELKQYVRHDDHVRVIAELECQLSAEREAREKAERTANFYNIGTIAHERDALRARIAELDKAIDEINVGINAGNAVIWIESISGFYMSVREAIDVAIKEQDKGEKNG